MNKFIVKFDDLTDSTARKFGCSTLGGSIPISAPQLMSTHSYSDFPLDYNSYAVFFTIALPTNGWSHRLKKHNPTLEEQENYFKNTFNLLKLNNKQTFVYLYSLEFNSDMANIHAHGVVHRYSNADLNRFKKSIRSAFKIISSNRVAIKYYKANPKYVEEKYIYHLLDRDYDLNKKNKVKEEYYSVIYNGGGDPVGDEKRTSHE